METEKIMEAEIFSKEVFSKTDVGTFKRNLPNDKELAKIYRYVCKSIQEAVCRINSQETFDSLWTKECCSFIIKYGQIKMSCHLYIVDIYDTTYGTKNVQIDFSSRYTIPIGKMEEHHTTSIRATNYNCTFHNYPNSFDTSLYRFLNERIYAILIPFKGPDQLENNKRTRTRLKPWKYKPAIAEEKYEHMSLDEILKHFSER